jgi:hypothetical protein
MSSSPQAHLNLDSGGVANYLSGSGSTSITYQYTVGGGESSGDLTVSSITVGDAADAVSNAIDTTLPVGNNLADNKALVISNALATINYYVRETCAITECSTSLSLIDTEILTNTVLTSKDLVAQNARIVVHIDQTWGAIADPRLESVNSRLGY